MEAKKFWDENNKKCVRWKEKYKSKYSDREVTRMRVNKRMDGQTDNENWNWKTVFSVFLYRKIILTSSRKTSIYVRKNKLVYENLIFNSLPFFSIHKPHVHLLIMKVIGKRQGNKTPGSESQSQSSICSTPGQSSASNKISSDWPDPPDIPICSTEDEAASIYSDSGENNNL